MIRKTFFILLSCSFLASCNSELSPEEKLAAEQEAQLQLVIDKYLADSSYCVMWRDMMDRIREQLPKSAPSNLTVWSPANSVYTSKTSSIPFMTYSFFMHPDTEITKLDKYLLPRNSPITRDNGVAQAERDVVWNSMEQGNYLFIYYPTETVIKGTEHDKDPISGKTTGTVVVFDIAQMKIAGGVEVKAEHDTKVPWDLFAGPTMNNVVYRELREQIIVSLTRN